MHVWSLYSGAGSKTVNKIVSKPCIMVKCDTCSETVRQGEQDWSAQGGDEAWLGLSFK